MAYLLIVDDDEDFASTTATVLRTEGYEVHVELNINNAVKSMEDKPPDLIPSGRAAIRVLSAVIALVLFTLLMPYLGFQLPLTVFLFTLLLTLGSQRLWTAVILSVGGGWVITFLFRTLLDLPLPMSTFEFLKNIGL